MTKGIIFQILKFCLDDGPGIRSVVFLKGCALHCRWCHNPEGLRREQTVAYYADKCIGCGACAKACQTGAHVIAGCKHYFDREKCGQCGMCTKACSSKALLLTGVWMTAQQVLEEISGDMEFYRQSGGGVTLSGGEPLLQAEFAAELVGLCKKNGIRVTVETGGYAPWEAFEALMPFVELWLFDYKESDPVRFKEETGGELQVAEDNLKQLLSGGSRVWLRCPVIPGVNDRVDHFKNIAQLKERNPGIEKVQLMPYHNTGNYKWNVYGMGDPGKFELPGQKEIGEWRKAVGDDRDR